MFSKLKFRLASVILFSCVLVYCISFFFSYTKNKNSLDRNIETSLKEVYDVDLVTSASNVSLYHTATVFLFREGEIFTFTDSYSEKDLNDICNAIVEHSGKKKEGRLTVNGIKIAYMSKKTVLNLDSNFEDYYDYIDSFLLYDEYIFVDYTDKYNSFIDAQKSMLLAGMIVLISLIVLSYFISSKLIVPIEQSYKREQRLLGDVSHELKTPVAIIASNVETIENKKDELVKDQTKWLKNIKSQTVRMQYLIKELLNFSSYRTKYQNQNLKSYNISRILEKLILSYEEIAYSKKVSIKYDIEPKIEYNCTQEDMNKLFSILIDNAIKYNIPKGYIEITLTKHNKKIIFNIKNSGRGIENDNIDKIFDRFYRESYARTQENENSFGLGLSIAKTIVDYYKGTISVKSEIDKETEFEIIFNK